MALGAIMAGVSIASSIAGTLGGLKSNEAAKQAAQTQAENTYRQRMEEIRRARRDQEQVTGQNRANIGASGLQFSGSAMRHLEDVQAEFARDINWRKKAASDEKKAIRAGAPGGTANLATVARGVGSIANTIANYNE